MNHLTLEQQALNLKVLLQALSAVNSDDNVTLQDLPIAIGVCANIADNIYCTIVNNK